MLWKCYYVRSFSLVVRKRKLSDRDSLFILVLQVFVDWNRDKMIARVHILGEIIRRDFQVSELEELIFFVNSASTYLLQYSSLCRTVFCLL